MKSENKFLLLFLIFLSFNALYESVWAQNNQTDDNLVQQLEQAYNQFDYEKCQQLLNTAFDAFNRLAINERAGILKYAAFIAVQNGNTTLATDHFWNLLNIDPIYSLDPVTTPPKALTLFQKVKIEYLQNLNQNLQGMSEKPNGQAFPWRALAFPGWEQLHRGEQTRGWLIAAAGVVSLGGFVYSAVMSGQKRDEYLAASGAAEISGLYRDYNAHYQRQYYFGYAFAAVWLFSQLDLIFLNGQPGMLNISAEPWHNRQILFKASITFPVFTPK